MTYWYNNPSALIGTLSNGDTITPANSGGAAGDAWDVVVGNVTFQSGKIRCTGSAAAAYVGWTMNAAQASISVKIDGAAAATGGDTRSWSFVAGSTTIFRVEERSSDRRFVIYDAAGYRWTSGASYVAPTTGDYRLEIGCSVSATAARLRFAFFADGDDTTPATTYSIDNGNTGSANITEVRGVRNNSTPTATREIVYAHATDTTYNALGPLTSTPPLISLGSDQTAEPLTTVSLTASHVAGNAPDAWTWAVVSDPSSSVTLSGTGASRTFTAPTLMTSRIPQPVAVVIGCTPSSGGTPGNQQQVTINVPPHQFWGRTGASTWAPRRLSFITYANAYIGTAAIGSSHIG